MKRKRVAKPTGRRQLGVAATVAAALPIALSLIPAGGPTKTTTTGAPEPAAIVRTGRPVFKMPCDLPFEDIETKGLEIDEKCTVDGNAGDNTAKRLENNAKNNFCADGTPTHIEYEDFKNLQAAADNVDDLRAGLKTSRKGLIGIFSPAGKPKLGEGKLVQFAAFVLDAHNSNVGVGKGENVNCKLPTRDDNDIHIELTMDEKDDDPCNGVTAEMSPHFRPEAWSELVNMKLKSPVRITGPLFFDDSHQPCREGKRPNPKRISVWEIHPIYQFEVCKKKTLAECDVKTDSLWIPLDQFHSKEDEAEP